MDPLQSLSSKIDELIKVNHEKLDYFDARIKSIEKRYKTNTWTVIGAASGWSIIIFFLLILIAN